MIATTNDSAVISEGIRQLHAACVDAVWRQDTEGFAALFSVDGQWKIAGHQFQGRGAIAEGFSQLIGINNRVLMMMGTPLLSIAADAVFARTYVTEQIKRKDGAGVMTMGTYYEHFHCQDGRWLFRSRHFDLHYYGPPDLSGIFYPTPDYGPPPAMPAVDAPTTLRL